MSRGEKPEKSMDKRRARGEDGDAGEEQIGQEERGGVKGKEEAKQ